MRGLSLEVDQIEPLEGRIVDGVVQNGVCFLYIPHVDEAPLPAVDSPGAIFEPIQEYALPHPQLRVLRSEERTVRCYVIVHIIEVVLCHCLVACARYGVMVLQKGHRLAQQCALPHVLFVHLIDQLTLSEEVKGEETVRELSVAAELSEGKLGVGPCCVVASPKGVFVDLLHGIEVVVEDL